MDNFKNIITLATILLTRSFQQAPHHFFPRDLYRLEMTHFPKIKSNASANDENKGILLIDHGSKKQESNEYLHDMRKLFRSHLESNYKNYVVQIAHMELCEPSINQGMRTMIRQNVKQIFCVPFFLSPGRHVQEDIPELIRYAVEELNVEDDICKDIRVLLTECIGSQELIVVQAIERVIKQKQLSDNRYLRDLGGLINIKNKK